MLDEAARFARSVALREGFKRAAGSLVAAGVPVVPLKGVVTAPRLYRDWSERPMADVDLLVPPERFVEARNVLTAAGYRDRRNVLPPAKQAHLDWEGSRLRHMVDLHGELRFREASSLTYDDMVAGASVDVATYGVPVILPRWEAILVHTAVHLAFTNCDCGSPQAEDVRRICHYVRLDDVQLARLVASARAAAAMRFALRRAGVPDGGREHLAWKRYGTCGLLRGVLVDIAADAPPRIVSSLRPLGVSLVYVHGWSNMVRYGVRAATTRARWRWAHLVGLDAAGRGQTGGR